MRTLQTPRLVLEPQVEAHAEQMFEVLRDPALHTFEGQPPASQDWLRERFARLESRHSPDGSEVWLNWVLRRPGQGLIGYVQATLTAPGPAAIAYVLHSASWGQGLASEAVRRMILELQEAYGAPPLFAVLKTANLRSSALLQRLGFGPAAPDQTFTVCDADESVWVGPPGPDLGESPRRDPE